MERIIVLDFGSQTTQLIARRIRELGVYSVVVPAETALTPEALAGVKGVIMSGSPESVYEKDAPAPDKRVYSLDVPVLGICYGTQRMMYDNGGVVTPHAKKEYGRALTKITGESPLFKDVPKEFVSWMSHGDSVEKLAPGFSVVAATDNGTLAAIRHESRPMYGLQFHPEVTHCENGMEILRNFVFGVCGAAENWNVDVYLQTITAAVKNQVGGKKVLLLISGGVDSSVVGALLLKTLDADQVYLMYIDTGLMRKDESAEVMGLLSKLGAKHLHKIDASADFLGKLKGVSDPEKKRRIIGDLFMSVQQREIGKLKVDNAFLAQGTLYTDMIESGKGVGKKAHVIKSHHNVRSPLVEKKREAGLIVEPLAVLYKDEVRALGRRLGLADGIVKRHPFPGPGLAVRIIGDITPEKVRILQNADAIYIEELKVRKLYDQIWQAFAVLLPLRSVGVSGDMRRYGYVLALRAIVSRDGMTADVFPFPTQDLLEISARITNEVKEVGRVAYDISSKPPATIEWE